MKSILYIILLLVLPVFVLNSGCCSSPSDEGTVVVLVAASLTEPMNEIKTSYQDKTGVKIALMIDSSSGLRRKIEVASEHNRDFDIFLSASYRHADALRKKGLSEPGSFRVLFKNSLLVVSHKEKKIESLAGLKEFDMISLGDYKSGVPCGKYAKTALDRAGIWGDIRKKVSLESTVKTVLMKTMEKFSDAGFVYRTDIYQNDRLNVIYEVPERLHGPIKYVGTVLKNRGRGSVKKFFEYLTGEEATGIFRKYGFKISQ